MSIKDIFSRIYTGYVGLVFSVLFILLLPAFLIGIQFRFLHKPVLFLNHLWARLFFILILIPVKKEWRFKRSDTQYIFCSNHFSFLDIPSAGFVPIPFKFIGKMSISGVPLFGYMFRKLHIPVNRESMRSRYASFQQGFEALREGFSLFVFAEGGIYTQDPPNMVRFKDGAFRMAIESKVPIVPVTFVYNHVILADDNKFLFRWHKAKVIFHSPIDTSTLTLEELPNLKKQVFELIQGELNEHFPENVKHTA